MLMVIWGRGVVLLFICDFKMVVVSWQQQCNG